MCADKELATLDRLAGPGDEMLKASRDDCVRADELRPCLVEAYATRIAERARAGSGDSAMVTGPVAFNCGRDTIEATFINSEPGYVVLAADDRPAVLPRIAAASGVAFEGRVDGEPWSLWNKGREATLVRSGREASCTEVVGER
ncbi:MAG TPA: MliC family protein [Sphingomicrobium sp.]|nr:MliC family protein [Sphingomicrobium sp.]